jgi:carbamoyltransferase
LCYAGGVALNSVANERLVRDGGFEHVYIMPAAEDSGTAIGAAYNALWQIATPFASSRRRLGRDAVGRAYTRCEIDDAIARHDGLRAERGGNVCDRAAELLAAGKVIGWFSGRSELGPRALGQRSILADPRVPDMKNRLNERVKFREAFRPYAPVILREHTSDWFEVDAAHADSPFMLRVMKFRPERTGRVPAVVHVDGTGRVQTVTAADNPPLHALLTAFHRHASVPLLLNTSFNTAGEPIVETPDDALWCFLLTDMDACIIEDTILQKPPGFASIMDYCPTLTCDWISEEYAVVPDRKVWSLQSSHTGVFRSFSEGRLADVNLSANKHRLDQVRIVVDRPWGRVVHVSTPDVLPLLRLSDGTRTAWSMFDAVKTEVSLPAFRRLLAQLARTGVIACGPTPVQQPSLQSQLSAGH